MTVSVEVFTPVAHDLPVNVSQSGSPNFKYSHLYAGAGVPVATTPNVVERGLPAYVRLLFSGWVVMVGAVAVPGVSLKTILSMSATSHA